MRLSVAALHTVQPHLSLVPTTVGMGTSSKCPICGGADHPSNIKNLALIAPDGTIRCQTAEGKTCTVAHVTELKCGDSP